MIIERLPEPIDALVIGDTLTDSELADVLSEAKSLCKRDGGNGVWINEIYKDITSSSAHHSVMNNLFTEDIADALSEMNSSLGLYRNINMHSILVNHYGNSQSLMLREDAAVFIAKTFIFEEPKSFEGGNIILQVNADVAYEQDIQNNMTVLFPASYYHGLSEVSATEESDGLYVITTYMFISGKTD